MTMNLARLEDHLEPIKNTLSLYISFTSAK